MPAAFHCRHHLPTISGGEGAGAALPLNPHYLHDHPPCPRSQPNLRDRNSSHEIGAILIAYEDLGYVPHNLTVGFNRDLIQNSRCIEPYFFVWHWTPSKSFCPLSSFPYHISGGTNHPSASSRAAQNAVAFPDSGWRGK